MDDPELRMIEQELDAALGGIAAPPGFAGCVRRRVHATRLTTLPEVLDGVGWMAILAAVLVVLLFYFPTQPNPYGFWAVAAAIVTPALAFAWKSLSDIPDERV